ncbi:hypothetical protein [Niveispirillum sp. KHB5.9]|uniref:hypothetical protein n=1 Tax=Niveispirillum sp. KHB5.9 TaxID=3400269 RepID=UPI003A8ADC26
MPTPDDPNLQDAANLREQMADEGKRKFFRDIISESKASLDKVDDRLSAADYASRKQADDQSHIARMVLNLFRWCVAVVLALLIFDFAARLYGVAIDNTSLVREVIDFVKVAILPLVTLVLGFYFGRLDSSRKDPEK